MVISRSAALARSGLGPHSSISDAVDMPLSFRWTGITDEQLAQVGLLPFGNAKLRTARREMVASLLCAFQTGQWISYSRDRNHYAGMTRYEGPGYTYANIMKFVEEFVKLGLVLEDRACPGRLGWRSRMKATDKLINAIGLDHLTPRLHELIRLRDASDKFTDYKDTQFTRAARRDVTAINEVSRPPTSPLLPTMSIGKALSSSWTVSSSIPRALPVIGSSRVVDAGGTLLRPFLAKPVQGAPAPASYKW